MLMHEWIKYREQQVERAKTKSDTGEADVAEPGAATERDHRAEALQVAEEVGQRADEAQARRLQALISRQQRLPLEVEADTAERRPERGPGAKESRDELIGRLLDPTLTLSETATLLGVCPTTVRRYTKRGVLRCFRTPGNQRRFRLSDVLDFIERQES